MEERSYENLCQKTAHDKEQIDKLGCAIESFRKAVEDAGRTLKLEIKVSIPKKK